MNQGHAPFISGKLVIGANCFHGRLDSRSSYTRVLRRVLWVPRAAWGVALRVRMMRRSELLGERKTLYSLYVSLSFDKGCGATGYRLVLPLYVRAFVQPTMVKSEELAFVTFAAGEAEKSPHSKMATCVSPVERGNFASEACFNDRFIGLIGRPIYRCRVVLKLLI